MTKSTFLKTVYKAAVFYSIIRFLILIVFRKADLYDFLYFHYSNDFAWFFLTILLPLPISIFIAQKLKSKLLATLGKVFLPSLFLLTIVGLGFNKSYWGYFIKRPSIFYELKDATEILSITKATKEYNNIDFEISKDTTHYYPNNYSLDLYYSGFERPYRLFSSLGQRGNLSSFKEIAKNPNLKITEDELKQLQGLILNSNFLEKPEEGYEEFGNSFNIQILEFTTSKERGYLLSRTIEDRNKPLFDFDKKYFLISINTGQLSNDHLSFYEFLIQNNQIIKKQKYFYDVAGIEGFEYPLLTPIFEIAFLILSLFFLGIFKLFIKLKFYMKI